MEYTTYNFSNEKIISFEKYLQIMKNDPDLIEDAQIILPKLGSNGFGAMKVKYRFFQLNQRELINGERTTTS